MNSLYCILGTSKQAVTQLSKRRESFQEESAYLLKVISRIRAKHPTLNCKALYHKIKPEKIGRDRFIAFCMEHGFRVSPPRNPRRTTDSTGVIRFPNLTQELWLSRPDQLWCSDITYFDVKGKFYYLTFILDAFTRRIVGWSASGRLKTTQTSLPALQMALKTRKRKSIKELIFHSDGGGQYYEKSFLALTKQVNIQNSMCEYAWENGKAERINGIIKNNYLRFRYIKNLADLVKATKQVVDLYNEDRPHSKLAYLSPIQFEQDWYLNLKPKASALG